MIITPDRLAPIRLELERGKKPSASEWENIATLQILDQCVAGREAMEDAAKFQEEQNLKWLELMSKWATK